jgi:hypothetical protein
MLQEHSEDVDNGFVFAWWELKNRKLRNRRRMQLLIHRERVVCRLWSREYLRWLMVRFRTFRAT